MATRSRDDNYSPNDTYLKTMKREFNILKYSDPLLEKNLPKNKEKLLRYIARYKDRNSEKLDTPYIMDYPVFSTSDKMEIYNATGMEPETLENLCDRIPDPTDFVDNMKRDKAYIIAMLLAYRYFKKAKQDKYATAIVYFIAYAEYMMAFTKYFKFKPDPDIIAYTTNNLSYKYKIKQLGSVHKMIFEHTNDAIKTYQKYLDEGADYSLLYITNQLRSRFNSLLNQFCSEFMKDVKAGNRIYTSNTIRSDGTTREDVSVTGEILELAQKYASKFYANPISETAIRFAINKSSESYTIPERDLRNTINTILNDPDNMSDVEEFFQCMFKVFLSSGNYKITDIHSAKFIVEMQKVYRPGNSLDENRVRMKVIVDHWLEVGNTVYRTTNRTATKNSFRKAIYDYFVIKIATS